MKVYSICWKRQKGKVEKRGTTHVIAEQMDEALRLFQRTYPDRELESMYKEGDDVLGLGA